MNNEQYHTWLNNPQRTDLPDLSLVRHRQQNPLDCLVICNMGATGYGLYTKETLKPGTIIGMYSGTIDDMPNTEYEGEYAYIWDCQLYDQPTKVVNSKNEGGIARFIQHLPINIEKEKAYAKSKILEKIDTRIIVTRNIDIDNFVNEMYSKKSDLNDEFGDLMFMNSEYKNNVQEANVVMTNVVIDTTPIIVCWTKHTIEANTQLGYSYGREYWHARSPCYFYKTGETIPLFEYVDPQTFQLIKKTNPLINYEEGIKKLHDHQYDQAITLFIHALHGFAHKIGDQSIECGNCYSAIASAYRDKAKIKQDTNILRLAIIACEKSINILHNDNNKLSKVKIKYLECIDILKPDIKTLYETIVKNIRDKKYTLAIYKLEYILTVSKDKEILSKCQSALSSCYRDTGNLTLALEHCKIAVELRKHDKKLLKITEEKLAHIQDMINKSNEVSNKLSM